jgi:hypothetical protein
MFWALLVEEDDSLLLWGSTNYGYSYNYDDGKEASEVIFALR